MLIRESKISRPARSVVNRLVVLVLGVAVSYVLGACSGTNDVTPTPQGPVATSAQDANVPTSPIDSGIPTEVPTAVLPPLPPALPTVPTFPPQPTPRPTDSPGPTSPPTPSIAPADATATAEVVETLPSTTVKFFFEVMARSGAIHQQRASLTNRLRQKLGGKAPFYGLLGSKFPHWVEARDPPDSELAGSGPVKVLLLDEGGQVVASMTLVKEDGRWKIDDAEPNALE